MANEGKSSSENSIIFTPDHCDTAAHPEVCSEIVPAEGSVVETEEGISPSLLEKWGFEVESRLFCQEDGTLVEQFQDGSVRTVSSGITVPDHATVASERRVSLADEEEFDPWAVHTLRDAYDSKNRQQPWVVKELLLAKSASVVSAQPHAMKSLSWLAACMEAPLTGKVWGHFEAPSVDSTLFIETEDPRWLVEARIVGLAKGFGITPEHDIPGFHYACVGPFDLGNEASKLEKIILEYNSKFVVLSTMQNSIGDRNWNSQQDMQPILATVVRLSRIAPMVMVTHSPQDSRQQRPAGTITQAANFSTLLHYEKNGDRVRVTMDSKAGMGGRAFSLKLVTEGRTDDPGSVRKLIYDPSGRPVQSGKKRAAIEKLLADNPSAKTEEIAQEADVTERYVQDIRRKMKKD